MDQIIIREELLDFAREQEKKLQKHDREKGESYKYKETTSFRYLEDKIDEEYDEYIRAGRIVICLPTYSKFKFIDEEQKVNDPEQVIWLFKRKQEELVDLANMCMMMHWRLENEIKKIKERQKEKLGHD